MGDSLRILKEAVERLSREEGLTVRKVSSFYRTKPWGKRDQPDFINAAALVEWEGSAEALMALLLQVEKEFGRERKVHWGPRTLDLDLIYSENCTRETEFLRLPHPYFWERPFVLVPMEEILPSFTYEGKTIHARILELEGYKDLVRMNERKEAGNE